MMGAICITLYNRYEYTKMLFDYLSQNDYIEKYPLCISIDHSSISSSILELCKSYPKLNIEYLTVHNPKLGCGFNQHFVAKKTLEKYDYLIMLEDDCIPMAKDTLNYFHTSILNIGENKFVSGYSRDNYNGSNLYSVHPINLFVVWGWATTKILYYESINLLYPDGMKHFHGQSWDSDLNTRLSNKLCVVPHMSRIQNVGALNGTHVNSADWHRANHHVNEGAWDFDIKTQEWGKWG